MSREKIVAGALAVGLGFSGAGCSNGTISENLSTRGTIRVDCRDPDSPKTKENINFSSEADRFVVKVEDRRLIVDFDKLELTPDDTTTSQLEAVKDSKGQVLFLSEKANYGANLSPTDVIVTSSCLRGDDLIEGGHIRVFNVDRPTKTV